MSIDLEKLKAQRRNCTPYAISVSGWHSYCIHCQASESSGHNEGCWWSVIDKLIEEVERLELARRNWAEEAQLATKNRDYQQDMREKAEKALHQKRGSTFLEGFIAGLIAALIIAALVKWLS